MIETLRKAIAMVPPRLRTWWLLMPVMAVAGGALEGAAAAAVFALVRVIENPLGASALPGIGRFVPLLPRQDPTGIVLQFAAGVAVLYVVKNALLIAMQYVRHTITGRSSADLACTMLRGYLLAPYPFHFRRNSAELVRNTTASVTTVFLGMEAVTAILLELSVGVGIFMVLLSAAPAVALVVGGALAALIALLLRLTRRMVRQRGQGQHALSRDLYQTIQNALGGIKEIKALGREEFFYRAFADLQRERMSLGYVGVTMDAVPQLAIETAFVWGGLAVVGLVTLREDAGAAILPVIGLFAYASFRMIPMANRLTWRINTLRESRHATAGLYDDWRLLSLEAGEAPEEPGPPDALGGDLVLADVTYVYPGSDAPSLSDVRLTIRRGESIGIVGPTGAGKSTLVDLIVGLLEPTSGTITAGGTSLAGRGRAWRRHVGYVPQSIFLLDDTLRRNIALGIPDAQIDEAAVLRAVAMAQIEPLVRTLPHGLDTELGERGVRISGGERQRVGIARALYHDPDLLVFDEATASLDTVTEAELTRAIEALHGEKTLLVIAHRLSTVRRCDRLVLVQDGRARAIGTYDELCRDEPEFLRLVSAAEHGPGAPPAGRG